MCRSDKRRKIVISASRVACGFNPRSMSLAPSSRMTNSVPLGTDQSSRATPSDAVLPETPALIISAALPLAASAACKRGAKPWLIGKPRPAVRESPSATIFTGAAGPACKATVQNANASVAMAACATWRRPLSYPYERRLLDAAGRRSASDMNDTSGHPLVGDAVALSAVNLSLGSSANRVHILKDIALNMGRGEAVSLLGPSGSGKSTLLMVMAGLERPDNGLVQVAGADLRHLNEDELARFRGANIGIVFQAFHLIPTMTALENVAVPLELSGARDAIARAESELAAVGLADRVGHYPAQLSGGEQQRVAIARALAPNPAILVADEPTGNLDETTGAHIIELLFRGKEQHSTTLVLVTHDGALAARCDRVLHMHSGRLATSPPQPHAEQTTKRI